MKSSEPSPPFFRAYSEIFRIQVHQLIAWGCIGAKNKEKIDDEEKITGHIYDAIKDVLRSNREMWCVNYAVRNEDPISCGRRSGKERKKIDLVLELVSRKGRPEYVFEAKPLNYPKKHQRTSNYVNKEGMGRFISGEYADYTASYPEVGMVGYVLSDSTEKWCSRLKKAISDKQKELRLTPPQQDIKIIDEFPLEWVSIHKRESSDNSIQIFHILYDFEN